MQISLVFSRFFYNKCAVIEYDEKNAAYLYNHTVISNYLSDYSCSFLSYLAYLF